jgi:hypothetical protein
MKPHDIERLSFQIIDGEAGDHGFPPDRVAGSAPGHSHQCRF